LVGFWLLDDCRRQQEVLQLLEDFFALLVPFELGCFTEQLHHRPGSIGQPGDKPEEDGKTPYQLLNLLYVFGAPHLGDRLTLVQVSLNPPVG